MAKVTRGDFIKSLRSEIGKSEKIAINVQAPRDYYSFLKKGSILLNKQRTFKFMLPAGNFRVQTSVLFANNHNKAAHYVGFMVAYRLAGKDIWDIEAGLLQSTNSGFGKKMSYDLIVQQDKSGPVELTVGSSASSGVLAENLTAIAERIGSVHASVK